MKGGRKKTKVGDNGLTKLVRPLAEVQGNQGTEIHLEGVAIQLTFFKPPT